MPQVTSWRCDGGVVVLPNGSIVRGRECDGSGFATDSASPSPSEPRMAVIEMPKWITIQPSARAMREADLISAFYSGVPFEVGRKRHEKYRQRKAEKELER